MIHTCATCDNKGTDICKDCRTGNPPSLWMPILPKQKPNKKKNKEE